MKTILYLIIPLLCLIALCSCGQERGKVGILIAGDSFQADCDEISSILKTNKIEVFTANAKLDVSQQIEQAKQLIKKEVDVMLIIAVNTNTSAEIVRACKASNIKTIAYERIISNCDLDYYVAFDNGYVGELLAQNAIKLKPTGKYALFNGDKFDRNAQWVYKGFMTTLEPHIKSGAIEIIYNIFIEDWSQENARFEFDQFITSTKQIPDVILSAHNRLSNGIISSIEQHNINQYPILTGQAAETAEARATWNEKQQIALFKSYKVESKAAAELALTILHNKHVKTDKHINNGLKDVPAIVLREMTLETR